MVLGPVARRTALAIAASAIAFSQPDILKGPLERGISAYRGAKYEQAAQDFEIYTRISPSVAQGFLYLGNALAMAYIPGGFSPENFEVASKAEAAFHRALELSTDNHLALACLGLLLNLEGVNNPRPEGPGKVKEGKRYLARLAEIDPQSHVATYSLGAINMQEALPQIVRARTQLRMKPEDPGPLRDARARQSLRDRVGGSLQEAFKYLSRALEIDPNDVDAMYYVGLYWQFTALLADTQAEAARAIGKGDVILGKMLQTRKASAEGRIRKRPEPSWGLEIEPMVAYNLPAPPPPPPPPPPPKAVK